MLKIEGTGWDIGHAVQFLSQRYARYITGQVLVVDGGVTLQGPERESTGSLNRHRKEEETDGPPALSRGRSGRARISRHAQAQHQPAQAPGQLAGHGARLHGVGGYIRHKSKLDPRLRELAILQVGWLEKSEYEFTHHVKIGKEFGVTDEDIQGTDRRDRGQAFASSSRWPGRS